MLNIKTRWMLRRHMAEVLSIEKQSFEFPWCERDFLLCLRQRNVVGKVATHDDRVVGFAIYELNKHSYRLLSLAVHPDDRRGSVGSRLIGLLKDGLTPIRRTSIVTEVRESNIEALLFFKSQGMVATGVVRDFYDDTEDDAIVMKFLHGWEAASV